MKKTVLTDVPSHIIEQPELKPGAHHWQADYNVAAWFRFQDIDNSRIRLNILWADDAGPQRVTVDHAQITSGAILMSGIARLRGQGPVRSMEVEVESDNAGYVVDELFVQPVIRAHTLPEAGNL